MDRKKRAALKAAGWRSGSAESFLKLDEAEARLVALKLRLSAAVRQRRTASHLTQHGLARQLKSSQSRVAKIEGGDPTVSFDLLLRALIVLGAERKVLAMVLA